MNYPISSIQPATTFRKNLFDMLEEINNTREAIVITRNDKPNAVILSYEAFDSLMETMNIMSDPQVVKELDKRMTEKSIPFDRSIFSNNLFVNDSSNIKYDVSHPSKAKHKKGSKKNR